MGACWVGAACATTFGKRRDSLGSEIMCWRVLLGASFGYLGGGYRQESGEKGTWCEGGEGGDVVVVGESWSERCLALWVVLVVYAVAWRGREAAGVVEALVGAG